jgi:small subunit ribosomal protein S20
MPQSLSAKKRLRQTIKRQDANKAICSEVKTYTKKLAAAVDNKDKATALKYFHAATSKLDGALKKGISHKNTIARKKSQCAKLLNRLG